MRVGIKGWTRRRVGVGRRLAAVVVVMAMAFASLLATESPSVAASGWSRGPGYNLDGSMIGFWEKNGQEYICLDTHYSLPDMGSGKAAGTAQSNWVMAKYLKKSTSDVNAAAAAIIIKDRYDDRSTAWKQLRASFFANGAHGAVKTAISNILADAKLYAGPYNVTPSLTLDKAAAGGKITTGKVSNIGVRSAAGKWVNTEVNGTGFPLTVKVSGGATFADGSTSKTLNASTSGQTLSLTNVPVGQKTTVSVDPNATLPAAQFVKHSAGSKEQEMAEDKTYNPAAGVASATAATTFLSPYSITVGSQVKNAYLVVGQSARDFVTVKGDWTSENAGAEVTIHSTLYGPFADQPTPGAEPPDDALVFDTFSTVRTFGKASEYTDQGLEPSDNRAHVTFESKPITDQGFYVWVEQAWLNADSAGSVVTSEFGRPWEMNYAAKPKVTSQIATTNEEGDIVFTDKVTSTGFKTINGADTATSYDAVLANSDSDGYTPTPLNVTLEGELLGPVDPVAGSCDDVDWSSAPTAVKVDGLGDITSNYGGSTDSDGSLNWYDVGEFHRPDVGKCYSYRYTFAAKSVSWSIASDGSADRMTTSARDVFSIDLAAGDPTETAMAYALDSHVQTQVVIGDGTKGETSGISPDEAPNASIDRIEVDGLAKGVTIPVQATLYGPIRVVAGGDQDTPYADGDETELLKAAPKESWSYATANPELAPVVQTFSKEVTGDGSGYQTVDFTSKPLTEDGWYVWVESSTGNPAAGAAPYQSSFGRLRESSVRITPSLGTEISAQSVIGQKTITDSFEVAGVEFTQALAQALEQPVHIVISADVYGPEKPINGSCQGIDWSHAASFPVGSEQIGADGWYGPAFPFRTRASEPGQMDCWTYGETMTASTSPGPDSETRPRVLWVVQHLPGKVSETVLSSLPSLVTQASAAKVITGGTVSDRVTVSGMVSTPGAEGSTGVMMAAVYGPLLPKAGKTCSSLKQADWQKALAAGKLQMIEAPDVEITGNGTFNTAPVALPADGCWTWYEKLFVGGTVPPLYTVDSVQAGQFGVIEETTLAYTPTTPTPPTTIIPTGLGTPSGPNWALIGVAALFGLGGATVLVVVSRRRRGMSSR